MTKWIKRLFGLRELSEALDNSKKVKIRGVLFTIRKLDPYDALQSGSVLRKTFDVKEVVRDASGVSLNGKTLQPIKAIRNHFRDVFLASVVHPHLSKEEGGESVCVDEIFQDWEMANELYEAIMVHTYGKKKVRDCLKAQSLSPALG